ncbi:6-phosphogluconolactonase [Arenibacter antarcticus]|uniref:6-phosphogluconolactonase n=1 Tax=Arenibacter antarcticus TaxID=2040469 RepID=A0ABW5VKS7_9FLAO|nr:6-phosphogluconolactonase [Arenibacter sp. H213]MCM4169161.1 6-phosphogluconolactonase [Arenibacter sp. H213]
MKINVDPSKAEVAKRFSEYLEEEINKSTIFHVALSGGSTPKGVFDYMSENAKGTDWSKVHLYWGDERCVAPSDSESNYKMTVDHLLSKITIPKENIHRVFGEAEPESEAVRYAKVLDDNLPKELSLPQFDLVILGMGDDGHTASIFPHEIGLWDSTANCEVAIHPDSGQRRITVTGKIINNAKTVAFLVTGESKAEKVKTIIEKEAGHEAYPASLVAPTSDNLIWFLDADAAAGII